MQRKQSVTRKDIELLLTINIPDDAVPFVIEFVNQLVAEHGEQWVRNNREMLGARLENMGLIPKGR